MFQCDTWKCKFLKIVGFLFCTLLSNFFFKGQISLSMYKAVPLCHCSFFLKEISERKVISEVKHFKLIS